LNVDTEEVEELLIGLILEGKVEGRIDQVGMRLELDRKSVVLHLIFRPLGLSRSQAKLGEKTICSPEEMDGSS
jgi:hypothetical protein